MTKQCICKDPLIGSIHIEHSDVAVATQREAKCVMTGKFLGEFSAAVRTHLQIAADSRLLVLDREG